MLGAIGPRRRTWRRSTRRPTVTTMVPCGSSETESRTQTLAGMLPSWIRSGRPGRRRPTSMRLASSGDSAIWTPALRSLGALNKKPAAGTQRALGAGVTNRIRPDIRFPSARPATSRCENWPAGVTQVTRPVVESTVMPAAAAVFAANPPANARMIVRRFMHPPFGSDFARVTDDVKALGPALKPRPIAFDISDESVPTGFPFGRARPRLASC